MRTKRENSVTICEQDTRATGLSKQCTDTGTRTILSDANTGVQLSAISLPIPFSIRCAGFILSKFTVRPDGRTPFQHLLGTPYVSPLCMFGESVFELFPDLELGAATLTNRWTSGCWWGRNMVGFSADQFAANLLETSGADVKRSKFDARSGIVSWKWILEYPDQFWKLRRVEGMPTATAPMEIPTVPPPAPPPEKHVFEMQVHSHSGGACVAAKTRMVIFDPSYVTIRKRR